MVLLHGYGWRQAEVARLLGITPSTVHDYLNRALDRLETNWGCTMSNDVVDQIRQLADAYDELVDDISIDEIVGRATEPAELDEGRSTEANVQFPVSRPATDWHSLPQPFS